MSWIMKAIFFILCSFLQVVSSRFTCGCSNSAPAASFDTVASIRLLNTANVDLIDFLEIVSVDNTECRHKIDNKNIIGSDGDHVIFELANHLGNVNTCFASTDRIDLYVSSSRCCSVSPVKMIVSNLDLNGVGANDLYLDFQNGIMEPEITIQIASSNKPTDDAVRENSRTLVACPAGYKSLNNGELCAPFLNNFNSPLDIRLELIGPVIGNDPSSTFTIVYEVEDQTGNVIETREMDSSMMEKGKGSGYIFFLTPLTEYYISWSIRVNEDIPVFVERRLLRTTKMRLEVESVTSTSISWKALSYVYDHAKARQWRFHYSISDVSKLERPQELSPTIRTWDVFFSEVANKVNLLSDLKPGRTYKIEWTLKHITQDGLHYSGEPIIVTTSCSCQSGTNDAPLQYPGNPAIVQYRGQIYFQFVSNSVCGNAFAFSRSVEGSEKELTFAPTYMLNGRGSCGTFINTKGVVFDDVELSKLTLGMSYRYHIRPTSESHQGQELSLTHTVLWESHLDVYLFAGNQPIADVTVFLTCFQGDTQSPVSYDSTITGREGLASFDVAFHSYDSSDSQCFLSVENTSYDSDMGIINHQFLCNDGRDDCTNLEIFLRNREFDKTIIGKDKLGVAISGKVFVANTHLNSNGLPWGDGCSVANATVCAYKLETATSSSPFLVGCTNTSADGTYSLIGYTGTRMFLNASFNGHPLDSTTLPDSQIETNAAFMVESDGKYENFDFVDNETGFMNVTVAGGLCDYFLGDASITISIPGCKWGGLLATQTTLKAQYTVPKQFVSVSVTSIKNRPEIELAPKYLDLGVEEIDGVLVPPEVRFQYNGTTRLRAIIPGDWNTEHCQTADPPSGSNADGLFVLPAQTVVKAIFYVEQDVGGTMVCDNIDPSSLQLMVHNNLGLLQGDKEDEEYRAAVEKYYDPEWISYLTHCNDGCLKNITRDAHQQPDGSITYRNSRLEFIFMTARPNIFAPFTKTLTVSTNEIIKPTRFVAEVIIAGQFKLGDKQSVSLPTHEPILIIRDPPGGGSSAYYKNIHTHIRAHSLEYREFQGTDNNQFGVAGMSSSVKACVGVGFLECSKIAEMTLYAGYKRENTNMETTAIDDAGYTGGVTVTWSYTTSTNPNFASDMSDVFVIPNLLVKYHDTAIVDWNETTCRVSRHDEVTFSLQSPENIPAVSFVTAFEIQEIEIPSLNKLISLTANEISECDDDCEDLHDKLEGLQNALRGWIDALALNRETKLKAESGESLVRPHEWFHKIAKRSFNNANLGLDGVDHKSGLVSSRLVDNAHARDNYQDVAQESLTSANTIKFAGGGSILEYHLNRNQLEQTMKLMGQQRRNEDRFKTLSNEITGEGMKFGYYVKTVDSLDLTFKTSERQRQTDDDSVETAIGFTLSDPNIGDVFDVDVYIDPVFGTFVFHTRSGRSMCPHEEGTVKIADPYFEIVSQPPSTVLADEKITFQLKVGNNGEQTSSFVLNYENNNISYGGLSFYRALPVTFDKLKPKESVILTFSVTRGPQLYEYPPLVLKFQVGCEAGLETELLSQKYGVTKVVRTLSNTMDANGNPKIVFARPCPKIEFYGRLHREKYFAVTLNENPTGVVEVTVRNPETEYMKMYNATKSTPKVLENIQLEYRQVGTTTWRVGYHKVNNALVPIDFASDGLETSYGTMTVNWEAGSGMMDGNYEMRVVAQCPKLSGVPQQYISYSTDTVSGVIDRKPLKLYGHPMPRNKVEIGQEIEIEFNKPLNCYEPFGFSVKIAVENDPKLYDNSNLLIICDDRSIFVQFDSQTALVNNLIGRSLTMNVSGVEDHHGNALTETILYHAKIVAPSSEPKDSRRRRLISRGLDENVIQSNEAEFKLDPRFSDILVNLNSVLEESLLNRASKESDLLKAINVELKALQDTEAHSKDFLIKSICCAGILFVIVGYFRIRR